MNINAILRDPQQAHARLAAIYRELKGELLHGREHVLAIKPKTRSLEQNARLWVLLEAISKQVVWHGQKLTAEEWKDCATASLKRHKVVPGIEGGFVVLGQRTSNMTVAERVELQEFLEAFGAQHNVDFGEVLAAEPA
jgi:hypothetical protein